MFTGAINDVIIMLVYRHERSVTNIENIVSISTFSS